MRRLVRTGTPGAGKTAILRQLELDGHVVVEEAATDVIGLEQARGDPQPWTGPSFVDAVVALQQQRQLRATTIGGGVQFFDRRVLFVDRLGFVTPTAARRITSDEAVRFERVHEDVYRSLGYECVHIRQGTLTDQVEALRQLAGVARA